MLGIATYIIRKTYLINSYAWRLEFLKKSEIYMKLNFSEAITTNMQIGKYFFVFKYPVTCKQNISKFSLFLLKLMKTFVFKVLTQ